MNQDLTEARSLVMGEWRPVGELPAATDLAALTKLHKLRQEELAGPPDHRRLIGSLLSRIAARDSL